MPDKNDNTEQNSGFKADDFDKEKQEAKKAQEQSSPATGDTDKAKDQEILKQQKETD